MTGGRPAHQINEGKQHHAYYTTASYWREQETMWSKNHWHKEHYEFTQQGVWRDSTPGPGSYSPLAAKPTGQQHKKITFSSAAVAAGELQSSTATLGSPCFKKAYIKKNEAWWGPPGFDLQGQKRRKRPLATNRICPPPSDCGRPECKSHEKSYPISICSCVQTIPPPDNTRCDLCKLKVPADELENHKHKSCPRYRLRCEYCMEEFERMFLNRHVEVECDAREFQCSWCGDMIPRGEWAEHRDYNPCPKKPVDCEWCFEHLISENYDAHQHKCPMRPYECPYCKQLFPVKSYKTHCDGCPMRPVCCRFCRANLMFADARHHREVCPNRPQVCKTCGATVEKPEWDRHKLGCHLIEAAKLLVPKLKIQALGISAEKLPPSYLPPNTPFGNPAALAAAQKKTTNIYGQRLIKVDKKGQVGLAGGEPGDFCYKIRVQRALPLASDPHNLVGESDTLTLLDFGKIVGSIRPGDIVRMWLHRPTDPRVEIELAHIENLDEHMQGASQVEIEFFAMGYWYNPKNEREKRAYSEDEIRTVIRLSRGDLTETDVLEAQQPFWVEHGKAWIGLEGPGGLTGTTKGRGFTKTTKVSPKKLGMVNRALSARASPGRRGSNGSPPRSR